MVTASEIGKIMLRKYRWYMASLLYIEQTQLQIELNLITYFVIPIYFIEQLIVILGVCQIQLPIFNSINQDFLYKISPYFILSIHLILFFGIIAQIIFQQLFLLISTYYRILLKNYDRLILIPSLIISFNPQEIFIEETIIRIINTIIIFICGIGQYYYFQNVHFQTQSINKSFSKTSILNLIIKIQIIIYQLIFDINNYLQYFCLIYFIFQSIINLNDLQKDYSIYTLKDSISQSILISILAVVILNNNTMNFHDTILYDFFLIETILLSLVFTIFNSIIATCNKHENFIVFYQRYYYSFLTSNINSNLLIFRTLNQIHHLQCNQPKCPCNQQKKKIVEKDFIQILTLAVRKRYLSDQKYQFSDKVKLQYIFILLDIIKNNIFCHQVILYFKKKIQVGYLQILLEVIEKKVQQKLIDQIMSKKQQMKFMEEMKMLKYEGLLIQQELIKVYEKKQKFFQQIKNFNIVPLHVLFESLYNLKFELNKIESLLKKLDINHSTNCGNIFSIRILQLVVHLTQDLREEIINQQKIDELVQFEIYKNDEFTNIAFTSNKAISLTAQLVEKQNPQITQNITQKQLNFLEINTLLLTNISQLLHQSFREPHQRLVEQYLRNGRSKIIGQEIDTTISISDIIIMPIKMILFPYFPKLELDRFQMISYLLKIDNQNNTSIQLDLNFNLMAIDQKFQNILDQFSLNVNQINIFQMLPQLKENLLTFHEKVNAKQMYFQNQTIQILQKFTKPNQKEKLNVVTQLNFQEQFHKMISLSQYQTIHSTQTIYVSQIDYEIQLYTIYYETELNEYIYGLYKIQIDLTQFDNDQQTNKVAFSIENNDKKALLQEQKSKTKTWQDNENIIVGSLRSKNSTTTVMRQTDDIFQYSIEKKLPKPIRQLFILLTFNFIASVISLIVIYILLQQKRDQQDICFNNLFFGTEFLDYYGIILKGSRHTVFYRDYHLYVNQSQTLEINSSYSSNISISDKITLSVDLYGEYCQNLINLYEQYGDYLNGYQSQTNIHFKFVDYQISKVETQIIETQAKYYEIMNSLFYLAIKTFAGDPSLYLKGTLDTFAQKNTRAILFLNFNDVCDITQSFIQNCLLNSQEYNNTFDNQVQIIFYAMYSFIIILNISILITLRNVIYRLKQLLFLFQRLDIGDIDEELDKLSYINEAIKTEEFWFDSKLFNNLNEMIQDIIIKKIPGQQQINIKLDDQFNLSLYYIYQTINFILFLLFLIIFQIEYSQYSSQINPIVNQALSAVQIRLNFVKTVTNWDVYNYQTFYKGFISTQSNSSYMSNNIDGDQKILSFVSINYTELQESIIDQWSEPFTAITTDVDESITEILLTKDICQLTGCNMTTIFEGRLLQEELLPYFDIGLIQLYKHVFQCINYLGIQQPDEDSYKSYMDFFLVALYSYEYFLYIFWGLDATGYQLKQFSDYFIDQAKAKLTSETTTIIALLFGIGISILIMILVISIKQLITCIQDYRTIKFGIRFIPLKVLVSKNIFKQVKLLQ